MVDTPLLTVLDQPFDFSGVPQFPEEEVSNDIQPIAGLYVHLRWAIITAIHMSIYLLKPLWDN